MNFLINGLTKNWEKQFQSKKSMEWPKVRLKLDVTGDLRRRKILLQNTSIVAIRGHLQVASNFTPTKGCLDSIVFLIKSHIVPQHHSQGLHYSRVPHLRNHQKETFRLVKNDQPPFLQEILKAHTQNKVSCIFQMTISTGLIVWEHYTSYRIHKKLLETYLGSNRVWL